MTATLFSLPYEVVAKFLEYSDIRTTARFEIAFPKYANIISFKSVAAVSMILTEECVLVNNCSVKYSMTVKCLKWLKSRRGMAPKALNFIMRSYPLGASSSDRNRWTRNLMSFVHMWSREVNHLAICLRGDFMTDEEIINSLLNPSLSLDLLTISYEQQSVCVCCQSVFCNPDVLMLINDIDLFDNDIKSCHVMNGMKLYLERLVFLKNPKQLRIFGSKRSTLRTIFWRIFGVISLDVEKMVLHAPAGYELYNFWADTDYYGNIPFLIHRLQL